MYGNCKWKRNQMSGQNFIEAKVVNYLRSVRQCVKLSVMIKNFEK